MGCCVLRYELLCAEVWGIVCYPIVKGSPSSGRAQNRGFFRGQIFFKVKTPGLGLVALCL